MERDPESGFVRDDFLYAEHPDPSWARRGWMSLDGPWRVGRSGRVREVRVPFPVGSEDSGCDFPDRGCFVYSRSFELPASAAGRSCLLRVGACDYETRVLVNGREAGIHVGGYASFSVDITGLARPGTNEIVLKVRDSHSPRQVRGKQTFLRGPFMVWYGGISGPWQSVWLEFAGPRRLERAAVRADFGPRVLGIEAFVSAPPGGTRLAKERGAAAAGTEPGTATESGTDGAALALDIEIAGESGGSLRIEARFEGGAFRCSVPFDDLGIRPWSPEDPVLYRLKYVLRSGGVVSDAVESYFGVRTVEARDGCFLLNGRPEILRMALVQGYYPGGVYTPRSHDREGQDIRALKRMGFNGARLHQKIESPYFLYLCDRLGLLATFEMPSFYLPSRRGFKAYEREFREIVARDSGHPAGIAWVLFNETWGVWGLYGKRSKTRRFVRSMIRLARELDPGRLVIDNSGWEHLDTDIVDVHHYLKTSGLARLAYGGFRARDPRRLLGASGLRTFLFYALNRIGTETRAVFLDREAERTAGRRAAPWLLSEYGGFGWYRSDEGGSAADRIAAYTRDAAASGVFQGYCLTQLYDVGTETNGILAFDRRPKISEERMSEINGTAFRDLREEGAAEDPGKERA